VNKHLKVFLGLLIVGGIVIGGARLLLPSWNASQQRSTSDAAATRGVLRIGVDNWIGYYPLCSPEMRRNLRSRGYTLQCIDDAANYAERFDKLAGGELDFAVATVDSWLLNGNRRAYPGVIVAVIDESKGGDAIVARGDRISDLNALSKHKGLKIAYTPASPSEHLLKSLNTHFDLGLYGKGDTSWQSPSDGSPAALKQLLAGEVDAAVLWEPDVSRALTKDGIVKLVGTEDTDKLIVDILIASRRQVSRDPDAVDALLDAWFETLKGYTASRASLVRDIRKETDLGEEQIGPMLDGVAWAGLAENGSIWFDVLQQRDIGSDGLIEAIGSAAQVLVDNGDFDQSPVPGDDPYRLTSKQFIQQLYQRAYPNGAAVTRESSLSGSFPPLSEQAWGQMRRIGTLKVEPISFRRGTGLLDLEGKRTIDLIVERLRRYPSFHILVEGHTGIAGDTKQNLKLSLSRAEAVTRYLMVTYNIDPDRLRAVGYGSSKPLPKQPGESSRSYSYRLPRVEISLLSGGR
jgi:outer membrane protein OmpA-like peptidoglycan-associated protein/ABC-type amino acid transport substrate-binding protein